MQVHQGLEHLPFFQHTILSIGTYDGVHMGHLSIIHRLCELAKQYQKESVILTFHPHPRLVLNPDNNNLKLITTIEEKAAQLEILGIDHLVIAPFTPSFSQMSAEQYIEEVLVKYFHPKVIVIGYDHRYGKNRSGEIRLLQSMGPVCGFTVEEIPAETIDDIAISSTKTRQALLEGDMKTANEFLSAPFTLCGKVIHGEKVGRTLGFPTANIQVNDPYKLIPPAGVYAVWVDTEGGRYKGALSIGFRPTFTAEKKLTIEVYLLDFSGELYDKIITLTFVQRLRGDKKYESVDELVRQMEKDVLAVNSLL